jgi:anaerobic C4-dicarboxylate transporter
MLRRPMRTCTVADPGLAVSAATCAGVQRMAALLRAQEGIAAIDVVVAGARRIERIAVLEQCGGRDLLMGLSSMKKNSVYGLKYSVDVVMRHERRVVTIVLTRQINHKALS